MARIEAKGLDAYMKELQKLNQSTDDVCKAGVYAGAKVIGDKIKAAVDTIPIHSLPSGQEQYYAHPNGPPMNGLSQQQADDLKKGFGIAKFSHENYAWNTKLGFNGYNSIQTKGHPKGQPNALIARCVEGGTSVWEATPFVAPSVRKGRKETEAAMGQAVEKKIKETIDK